MRPVTSASNLFRRALCPGSERLEYGLPEEDSEQSREGTLLHDYAAHPEYQRDMLKPDQRDLLERNDTLIQTIGQRIEKEIGMACVSPLREPYLKNDLLSGTPDLVTAYPTEDWAVWVNDSKFGYKIVERAELNLQLRAYALLVFDHRSDKCRRVFVSITQPRLPYDERITLAEYNDDDIEASRVEIAEILKRASHDRAKLVAGEEQCRYCKAKLICPEFQRTMTKPVLPITPDKVLSKTAREAYFTERLAKITNAQLEALMGAVALAGMAENQIRDEARRRIAAGNFPGWYLSKPAEKREIVDTQKAVSLLELGRVATRDELMSLCSIPLGDLEEAYRKRTDCTWKEAREKVDKLLASVMEKTEMKPRVMRDTKALKR